MTGVSEHEPGVAWDGVSPLLHVVLHEPEIPNNTGNIGRTCVALGSSLHLIHPIGFELSEKACRRAGLDYWPRLSVHEHDSWGAYRRRGGEDPAASARPHARWLLSTRAGRSAFEAPIRPGDHLVFGKESRGLPRSILDEEPEACVCLPMVPGERSLNLATAVAAVMYGALNSFVRLGWVGLDDTGRIGTRNITTGYTTP